MRRRTCSHRRSWIGQTLSSSELRPTHCRPIHIVLNVALEEIHRSLKGFWQLRATMNGRVVNQQMDSTSWWVISETCIGYWREPVSNSVIASFMKRYDLLRC